MSKIATLQKKYRETPSDIFETATPLGAVITPPLLKTNVAAFNPSKVGQPFFEGVEPPPPN